MTTLIWLLMFLIHCPKPKAIKPQKELAKSLTLEGVGTLLLIPKSQRRASMNMTRTSLIHETSKQNSILEIHRMILKALDQPLKISYKLFT